MQRKYEVIVFDLGGVLLDISGVQDILSWLGNRLTLPEFWLKWINSDNVQAFEKGLMSPDTFVRELINEFDLAVSEQEFVDSYSTWIKGVFPSVEKIINQLKLDYKVACLTNTNLIHWPEIEKMQLLAQLDYQFVSFKMGAVKPNSDIYQLMLDELSVSPEQVLFVDDNQINVDAALALGIDAYRVVGISELQALLKQLNLID
ncbi:HAD family hydrolase [Catenovulum maritimum]|uniref:HAD family hydrolase n=1 Tax=Catenovulum maritimum TaxID=1513271 RepID=A0A0J8GYS6_9ALTE|nr:HAD family phosphatase [Catenovulum maritimum]KMT66389.1 hypothetical protein XM47_03955 [Catenovulum maritimum]